MKNNGFTLIELLAVIVILAIIALIATPIVLNIINDSKERSNERSIELYAEALKEAIARYQLNNNESVIGKFTTIDGSILIKESTDLAVDYDGDVVCSTIELYSDGNIYLAGCKVNKRKKEYTYGIDQSYDNGQVVYFDVMEGKRCTEEEYKESYDETKQDYLNSSTGYNGIIVDTDNDGKDDNGRNSCLKFYAFLDDGSDKINLLLDHNTTATIAWTNSSTTNTDGPVDVINQLKEDTNVWKGTITPENYEYRGTERPYLINYKDLGYKARLITANEIAQITGSDKALEWDETSTTSTMYYLDGAKGTDPTWKTPVVYSENRSEYYWLFDRTSGCTEYGCYVSDSSNYGYWTSSALASISLGAWYVSKNGYVHSTNVNDFFDMPRSEGVRPVITVLKSNI